MKKSNKDLTKAQSNRQDSTQSRYRISRRSGLRLFYDNFVQQILYRRKLLTIIVFVLFGGAIFLPTIPLLAGKNLVPTLLSDVSYFGYDQQLTEFRVFVEFIDTKYDLKYVAIPSISAFLPDQNVCVDKIFVDMHYENSYGIRLTQYDGKIRSSMNYYQFDKLCAGKDAIHKTKDGATHEPRFGGNIPGTDWEEFVRVDNSYYYPFDFQKVDFFTWIEISTENANREISVRSIAPRVIGYIDSPDWDENFTIRKEFSSELGHEVAHITIVLRRPLGYRILTVVLLLSLFLFIFLLLFVKDFPSFVEVALGILLGLWSIQEVLIPSNVTWSTILDPLILFLYVFLAFIILLSLFMRNIWPRLGDSAWKVNQKKISRSKDFDDATAKNKGKHTSSNSNE